MKRMNQALLAKTGWRLYQGDCGLWGTLLKNKYLKGGSMTTLDDSNSKGCSSTWRGFSFGAKLLTAGMAWRIGNGSSVGFWTDVWLPDLGRLRGHALSNLSVAQVEEKVSDYLIGQEWDLVKLSAVLPWNVVHRIFSIHIPGDTELADSVIWGASKNGSFSVRSAYDSYFGKADFSPWQWNFIWKLQLPPRVLYFLWILLRNKLLTNESRAIRGITDDISCGSCVAVCENTDHVFRSCCDATRVWNDLCRGITSSGSFRSDWNIWLLDNLKCNDLFLGRIPGYLLFATTLWFIWKWRCEKVFNRNYESPLWPGKLIVKYVDDWMAANSATDSRPPREICFVSWSPPPSNWVKVNVDGSWKPDIGSIAAGGIVRNERKEWLFGFAMNKGNGNIAEAELWGILEGLRLVWNAGFRKVLVETDSQCAVLLLSTATPLHHPLFNLIEECKSHIGKEWLCRVQHVYREGNKAADFLASMGHSLDMGLSLFDDPPLQILSILEQDSRGFATARLIPCA